MAFPPAPVLSDTTDAEIKATGALKIKESILYRLLISNRDALKKLIWGQRFNNVLPHNHGNFGGSLLGRPLCQLTFGPHFREGTANPPVIGIPIAPPQAGVSMVTSPKLLASSAMLIPGGITSLFGRVAVRLPGAGTREVTLIVSLRAFAKAGYGPTSGQGVQYQSVTINTSGASGYYDAVVTLASLVGLGGENYDRWVEVCLWQASDPPAATTYRALFLALWPGSESTQPLPAGNGVSLSQVDTNEMIAPNFLVDKWLRRGRYTLDGLIYGVLGQVPGKTYPAANPDAPNRTTPWYKIITGQHQHTGRSQGDGAILRYPLSAVYYGVDFGDDVSGDVTAEGYLGLKIDPDGNGTGAFNFLTRFNHRVSIAKGCRGLDLYLALLPGHNSPTGKLSIYINVRRVFADGAASGSTDIVTNLVSSGGASVGIPTRILGFRGIEVLPINSAGYAQNISRNFFGLHGHWTGDAELPDTQLDTGVRGENLYRISDLVRIEINPLVTDDYIVECRMALRDQANDWVSSARLQWMAIAPSQGY